MGGDVAPVDLGPFLTASVSVREGMSDVALAGELDLSNCDKLERYLHATLERGDVAVDLSAITFVDVRGCTTLERLVRDSGGRLTLRRPCRSLELIARALGSPLHDIVGA